MIPTIWQDDDDQQGQPAPRGGDRPRPPMRASPRLEPLAAEYLGCWPEETAPPLRAALPDPTRELAEQRNGRREFYAWPPPPRPRPAAAEAPRGPTWPGWLPTALSWAGGLAGFASVPLVLSYGHWWGLLTLAAFVALLAGEELRS